MWLQYGGLKCPLMAINREMDNNRLRYPLGCHGMVELDDHLGVEEPTRGHKRLQGVPLHKSLMESLSSGSAAKAGKS